MIAYIFVQDNYNNNDYYFLLFRVYFISFTYLSLSVCSAVYFMFPVENNMYIYTHTHLISVIIFY